METIKNTCNREVMLRLIDRYFEAETSLEEERYLRRLLVETDCDDPTVEAARAVMGVFAVGRKISDTQQLNTASSPKRRFGGTNWAVISAVASVAIIIVAVVSLMNIGQRNHQDMLSVASAGDLHDSIAQLNSIENTLDGHHNSVVAAMTINYPETSAEIDALIKSELGLMAEAQNSVYESVVNDFTTISSIMK